MTFKDELHTETKFTFFMKMRENISLLLKRKIKKKNFKKNFKKNLKWQDEIIQ